MSRPRTRGPRRTSAVTEPNRPRSGRRWQIAVLLLVLFAAYAPAWHGTPVWDDDEHLTRPELQQADGLWRIWTELGATQQYYPVTHSVFWLQHRLWGDDTTGYHLLNIALHGLSAVLLLLVLRRLEVAGAAVAATLFALHPIQVESVAWITELKNTLSGTLFLAAALNYLRYDRHRDLGSWLGSFILFVAALFAKSVTATLPAALLVVFWWKRGRVELTRDLRPLIPFLAVGAAAGLFTTWVERVFVGAQGATYDLSLVERCLVAGRAVWFYLAALCWPSRLIFTYPRWAPDATAWWQYGFPLAALALGLLLWRVRGRTRAPIAAYALFVVLLAPALGFFDVYPFRYSFVADHFAYLATMPAFAFAGAALAVGASRARLSSSAAAVVAVLGIALPLASLTYASSGRFADAETLYRRTLADNPDSWLAHGQLGMLLHRQGRVVDALVEYDRARALNPELPSLHNNACSALWQLGRFDDARRACDRALQLDPDNVEANYNAGKVAQLTGRLDQARAHFTQALQHDPTYPGAHYELGVLDEAAGRRADAIGHFRAAIRTTPKMAAAHNALGVALVRDGQRDAGIAELRTAFALNPLDTDAAFNVGTLLLADRRFAEAIAPLQAVVAARPRDASALANLGAALEGAGRIDEARRAYRDALAADSGQTLARAGLDRIGG